MFRRIPLCLRKSLSLPSLPPRLPHWRTPSLQTHSDDRPQDTRWIRIVVSVDDLLRPTLHTTRMLRRCVLDSLVKSLNDACGAAPLNVLLPWSWLRPSAVSAVILVLCVDAVAAERGAAALHSTVPRLFRLPISAALAYDMYRYLPRAADSQAVIATVAQRADRSAPAGPIEALRVRRRGLLLPCFSRHFSSAGNVMEIRTVVDPVRGVFSGRAIIWFRCARDARHAVRTLQRSRLPRSRCEVQVERCVAGADPAGIVSFVYEPAFDGTSKWFYRGVDGAFSKSSTEEVLGLLHCVCLRWSSPWEEELKVHWARLLLAKASTTPQKTLQQLLYPGSRTASAGPLVHMMLDSSGLAATGLLVWVQSPGDAQSLIAFFDGRSRDRLFPKIAAFYSNTRAQKVELSAAHYFGGSKVGGNHAKYGGSHCICVSVDHRKDLHTSTWMSQLQIHFASLGRIQAIWQALHQGGVGPRGSAGVVDIVFCWFYAHSDAVKTHEAFTQGVSLPSGALVRTWDEGFHMNLCIGDVPLDSTNKLLLTGEAASPPPKPKKRKVSRSWL